MAKLKINHYVVGPVQTNCYFAINDETKELIIIDPGYSPKQLAERVRQEGCTPVAILLTHGHFDHATGAADLAKEFSLLRAYLLPTLEENSRSEAMETSITKRQPKLLCGASIKAFLTIAGFCKSKTIRMPSVPTLPKRVLVTRLFLSTYFSISGLTLTSKVSITKRLGSLSRKTL